MSKTDETHIYRPTRIAPRRFVRPTRMPQQSRIEIARRPRPSLENASPRRPSLRRKTWTARIKRAPVRLRAAVPLGTFCEVGVRPVPAPGRSSSSGRTRTDDAERATMSAVHTVGVWYARVCANSRAGRPARSPAAFARGGTPRERVKRARERKHGFLLCRSFVFLVLARPRRRYFII